METRKAKILRHLGHVRTLLAKAADLRVNGAHSMAVHYANAARIALDYARGLMEEAPASTRRRWKHAETIKARKFQARKAHAVADACGFERIGPYANL